MISLEINVNSMCQLLNYSNHIFHYCLVAKKVEEIRIELEMCSSLFGRRTIFRGEEKSQFRFLLSFSIVDDEIKK